MRNQRPIAHALAATLFLLLVGSRSAAQQEAPVLRATTRLVLVSVVVQGADGAPVEGLSLSDFNLQDEGETQKISLFAMEKIHGPAPATLLPPNTFSNRIEDNAGGLKSVTVILLDYLNTRWQDRTFARQHVVKFLEQLQPDDRVALYALSSDIRILHNFTTDARPLLRAVARYKNAGTGHVDASNPEEPNTGDLDLDDFLREQNLKTADFFLANRAKRTADAMEAIANHLAPYPGRKNLVWISSSFPISIATDTLRPDTTRRPQEFSQEIERTARALNNANLAVYPVDAGGLVVGSLPPGRVPSIAARTGGGPIFGGGNLAASHDTMVYLADRTGGRAFYNSNDIATAIRRAVDDSHITYVLGYYPTHSRWDGRFRRIRVTTQRRGLRLRHRTGYFAFATTGLSASPADRREALLREARSPLRSNAVSLTLAVAPVPAANQSTLSLTMSLDPRRLTFEPTRDRWVGTLDFLFSQYYGEGEKLHHLSQTVDLNLTRETYTEILRSGLALTKSVELQPGAQELVVVACDVPSGSLGSVSIPISRIVGIPAAENRNPR